MTLGLFIICLCAIFRRTGKPWLVAGRMLLVFFVSAIVLQLTLQVLHIAGNEQARLAEGVFIFTLPILTGFRQAKNFPRSASNVLHPFGNTEH